MSAAPSLLEENNITYEEAMASLHSQSPFYNPFTHKKVVHRWRTEWVPKDQPVALTPCDPHCFGWHDVNEESLKSALEASDREVVRSLIASLNEVAEPIEEEEEEQEEQGFTNYREVVHRWRTEYVPDNQPVAFTPAYNDQFNSQDADSFIASLDKITESAEETDK